ncbi:hypothetical protein [Massilia agri]|uniref:Flagellar protein FliT n=1 Tax=Massilia agri TaxID=1886785 RepID=A0ABT2AM11_9BURK|nr:hypothetical protein [Massilia agri]MCS0597030.1 hypothetical protein [Massilia agri]
MDRSGVIDRLAGELEQAAAQRDWELLGRAVRDLAPRLQRLATTCAWSDGERAALARLRGAHDGAAARVALAGSELQAQLAAMRDNKEGWMAYALAGEPETGNTQ